MGIPTPSPTTRPPSVPDPSLLCSPQKDGGPPVGLRDRAGCPPSILLCWDVGAGSGKTGVRPPTPPLPVPYILERHPLPGASAQRGTMVCTFISPRSGHSRGGALQQGPQKECNPGRGGGSGGGGASTSGPLRLHRGPPSAKQFPLSRSKNTKLGTPGAPHPGSPARSPPPPPPQGGHLEWGV